MDDSVSQRESNVDKYIFLFLPSICWKFLNYAGLNEKTRAAAVK